MGGEEEVPTSSRQARWWEYVTTTVGDALKLPDEAWARAEVREASPDDRCLVLERFDARGDVLDAEEFQANLEASISLDIEDDDSAGMTVH